MTVEMLSVTMLVRDGQPFRVQCAGRTLDIEPPGESAQVWAAPAAFAYLSDVFNKPVYRAVVGETAPGGELNMLKATTTRNDPAVVTYDLTLNFHRYAAR